MFGLNVGRLEPEGAANVRGFFTCVSISGLIEAVLLTRRFCPVTLIARYVREQRLKRAVGGPGRGGVKALMAARGAPTTARLKLVAGAAASAAANHIPELSAL